MTAALRRKFAYIPPDGAVDHLVIGAGVVGMAIARQLSLAFHEKSTFLTERLAQPGQETSARNSGVIHAGIYYPKDSLKTLLCVQGRELLYKYCRKHNVAHRKVQKMVVATSDLQQEYLHKLYTHASSLPNPPGAVPVQIIPGEKAREMEPDLSDEIVAVLLSPETGIVDAHGLIASLENEFTDAGDGTVVYGTKVVRIDRSDDDGRGAKGKRGDAGNPGWVVQTVNEQGERAAVLARCVVNSAGLNAHNVVNHILPACERKQLYFCKGSYFSYRGPGVQNVSRLLYPCPEPGLAGLGTHLTMDLAGQIRFGPDVEWLKAPDQVDEEDSDFWATMLQPNEARHDEVFDAVKRYLPGVQRDLFQPDYAGIRPKLMPGSESPEDFSIKHVAPGFIDLMGVESPGLTSSLAIAEHVERLIRKEVHGLGLGSGKTVSAVGRVEDDWA